MKHKIAFLNLRDNEEEFFRKEFKAFGVDYYKTSISQGNEKSLKNYTIISVIGPAKIDSQTLDKLRNIKLVTTRSTGFDHIDILECTKRGIKVANVPTYGEITVAEYTFALILALSRKIYQSIQRVKIEKKFSSKNLEGFDLNGKTIGIIGTGHIGAQVIKIAKGFGLKVLAFDAYPDQNLAQNLGFEYVNLEKLLKNSDIISLHVPLLPSTKYLINSKNIKLFKKGAALINTSRGAVLETKALIRALETNILSSAALDVVENERLLKGEGPLNFYPQLQKLLKMDNVIVSPHNSYNSAEAKLRILETTAQNIKSFLRGKPINLVENLG